MSNDHTITDLLICPMCVKGKLKIERLDLSWGWDGFPFQIFCDSCDFCTTDIETEYEANQWLHDLGKAGKTLFNIKKGNKK